MERLELENIQDDRNAVELVAQECGYAMRDENDVAKRRNHYCNVYTMLVTNSNTQVGYSDFKLLCESLRAKQLAKARALGQ
jgi:predicted GNAT family N-acyltransferase